ncbi:uncharacterized protein BDR25DRAFT_340083 [Lindgomyces ingoldianus]|uniref:Uncharacterized protein n=1 Tax=Lindgomyces ingoldianus TaxID=673940 RepID=A0ACB6R7F8_9PLEO|nr:uncharacterized protein BDR25DRAFT_340083 [Lindgomyces ingoldianus]KAF2475248.1 hypothetical protein BDR25DRAFT_340083 [Lindgomyces ingoldianus]
MSTPGSFNLFTSLRYDPLLLTSPENSSPALNFISPSPFYMLVYHRDRMLEAAQHFEFHEVAKLLVDGVALHEGLLEKVRRWVGEGGKEEALKPSPLTGGALTLGHTDTIPSLPSLPSQSPSQSPTPSPKHPLAPTWTLRLDTTPTPMSPFTLLKTTHRTFYSASRSRALPHNAADPAFTEVMLYNECQELTEGTTTSLYVFRGGRWITPPVGVPAGEFSSSTLKAAASASARDEHGDGGVGKKQEDMDRSDEGELRKPFAGRWGHSVRSEKVGSGGQRGTTRRWALAKGMCMEEPVGVDTVTIGEGVWVSNGVRGFGFGKVVS